MAREYLLYLSAFLFSAGIAVVVTRRNAILILIGIELILNAANLNLVTFSRSEQLQSSSLDGQLFALFIIVVAVCEAAVGIAIVLKAYHFYHTAVPNEMNELKEKK